jgi:hypothetical protein
VILRAEALSQVHGGAPLAEGILEAHEEVQASEPLMVKARAEAPVWNTPADGSTRHSKWAALLARIYEIFPLIS